MKTIVIAPHADDELLGCGGTLIKRGNAGEEIAWLLITNMIKEGGWNKKQISEKEEQINFVRKSLNIKSNNFFNLNFPTTKLDQFPINQIIKKISDVFIEFEPNEIFIPHPGDIHSDHKVVFEAAIACTKWFRYPTIKTIYTYETISETDFGIDPRYISFKPNTFVDISNFLEEKLKLIEIYKSEINEYPFPRSIEAIKALSKIRGAQMGVKAAEAFCLLKHREL